MGVCFNEEANVYVSNELSLKERKNLWCCSSTSKSTKTRAVSKTSPQHATKKATPVLANSREDIRERRERRRKVRSFVRSVVDEHHSLHAMGVNDNISLFRMSAACSKTDVMNAQVRAGCSRSTMRASFRTAMRCC